MAAAPGQPRVCFPRPVRADRRGQGSGSLGLLQGPVGWPQPGTRGGAWLLGRWAAVCVCVPSAGSWGLMPGLDRQPWAEGATKGPACWSGKRWDPGRVFPSGALRALACRAWTWRGGWFAVCVFAVQPALALGGAQKPARARAFSGRGAASGGRAGQGRGARPPASPQLSLRSASPGVGAVPTVGAPGSLPPPAWEEQTQSFTLPHTEGCLFFICRGIVASILVFLCFGVTQAKDGPFSRPHPGNLPFLSPCVPSGGAVLRLESVCAAACEWPAPPPPLACRRQRGGRARRASQAPGSPSSPPTLGPRVPLLPTRC